MPLQQEPSSPLSSVPSSAPSPAASDSSLSDVSDSELSEMAHTLARPRSYPSPSSSNRSSAKTSPAPENMPSPPSSNDDDERPRKKRKIEDPKDRTVQRLDLRKDLTDEDKPQLDRLVKALHKKRKIVVIAGAGMSVSAGIPDFRSSTGLFKSLRNDNNRRISSGKDLFDASVYQNDSSTSMFHDMVRTLSQKTKGAEPTPFHHLLATLAHEGRLLRLYTQNVDGIDTSLPPLKTQVPLPKKGPWPKTVQLHGALDHMVCSKCHAVSDFDAEIFDGPTPPACPSCHADDLARLAADRRRHGIGCLRPRMVLYNEHNPDDEAIGLCSSADLRTRPDAVIVVGTTLKVPGAKRIVREMCNTVRDRKDGITIWINNEPEPIGKELGNLWDLIVQGPCDEVARHAAMQKWDDPVQLKEVSSEEVPKSKPSVVIPGTPKKVLQVQGMPTPAQSPRMGAETRIKTEDPPTPSKKGAKRTSAGITVNAFAQLDGKPKAKVPAKRTKAQPKKAAAAPRSKVKKETKPDTPAITANFKQKKKNNVAQVKSTKLVAQMAIMPKPENLDTLTVAKRAPATPRKDGSKVTVFKSIGPFDPRYNHSPIAPAVEALSPVKARTPSEQLQQEQYHALVQSQSESRPSTADSTSSRLSIANLLNPTEILS